MLLIITVITSTMLDPRPEKDFSATGRKLQLKNQGIIRQKYVKFIGETRSIRMVSWEN